MRLAVAAAAVLLTGCQRTATEDALIEKAQREAFLPDCASLRVVYSRQVHSGELPDLVVRFAGSHGCMSAWNSRLEASGWSREHHGGWSSPDGQVFGGTFANDPNRGLVVWWHASPVAGVRDFTEAYRND